MPGWVVLLSVTLRSSRVGGMAVAGVPCRWRAGSTGRLGVLRCSDRFPRGAGFRVFPVVSAGQAGVLAMVMTAGAMRVILSFGPECGKVLGDFDLRSRCRFRSVTTRYFAICLVTAR